MTNPYTDAWAQVWCQHEVLWHKPGGMTATGPSEGKVIPIQADVDMTTRVVLNQRAEETTVSATVSFPPTYDTPSIGDTMTLPAELGDTRKREVITVTVQVSGNGMTPDHKEVTLR